MKSNAFTQQRKPICNEEGTIRKGGREGWRKGGGEEIPLSPPPPQEKKRSNHDLRHLNIRDVISMTGNEKGGEKGKEGRADIECLFFQQQRPCHPKEVEGEKGKKKREGNPPYILSTWMFTILIKLPRIGDQKF